MIQNLNLDSSKKEIQYVNLNLESFDACLWGIDIDTFYLKRQLIALEEKSVCSSVFDFDVYNSKFEKVSRLHIGSSPRKCFICERNAVYCAQLQSHSYEELIKFVKEKTLLI